MKALVALLATVLVLIGALGLAGAGYVLWAADTIIQQGVAALVLLVGVVALTGGALSMAAAVALEGRS